MAKIALENVRIAFVNNLWTPGNIPSVPNSPPAYSCRLIIEPGSKNDTNIKAAIKQAAQERFKAQADMILEDIKFNKMQFCYIPGDRYRRKEDGSAYDGFVGMMSLTAKRRPQDGPPMIINRDNTPVTQESGVIYSGCYVDALVEPFAYQGKPNSGVSCGLLTVRFRAQGPSFGGASVPTSDGLPPVEEFENDVY